MGLFRPVSANDTSTDLCCKSKEAHSCVSPERFSAPRYLTDYSPTDKPWNLHRKQADSVAALYADSKEFENYFHRISECCGRLNFAWQDDRKTGETRLKLQSAQCCRARHCPVCQWRRSLMWLARFYQSLLDLILSEPKARWMMLTLTVRNCEITDLSDTLKNMNHAWQKMIQRKDLKPVIGWVRTTEVTRGKDGSVHPHFHALLMVPPSMFTKHYIKQSRWVELWQSCLKANYAPNVDVRTVKANPKRGIADDPLEIAKAGAAEVLKYAVKPADMTADKAWFLELTRQLHKKRFIATGGVLKDVFKDEETPEELIHMEGEPEDEKVKGPEITFNWDRPVKKYKRSF